MNTKGILSQMPDCGSLCFLTCCEEGAKRMGPLMHPDIVLATATLGLCLPACANDDLGYAVPFLKAAVDKLAAAGADFYVCASNSPHGVLALFADQAPIPCLHMADVVAAEIARNGWRRVGFLGTRSAMTGTMYRDAFRREGIEKIIPEAAVHDRLDKIIFEELALGRGLDGWRDELIAEIAKLEDRGAECIIMARSDPGLIDPEQSPLPILNTTRLVAEAAVDLALRDGPIVSSRGW